MKHKISLIILLVLLAVFGSYANNPKEEFRATWMATVFNIDWPKTAATSTTNRAAQQKELTDIFDKMKAGNMNAVCLQVRGRSDAFYQSSYEPWAAELTGTRGKDPGYDPLAFAIEEAHKRGMELHVWVNPFRVTSSGTLSTSDKVWQNAGKWIIKYNNGSFNGQIIDPGYPEAREYVLDVLMEIVENYDVDGILMDDYFYPYGGTTTEDAASKSLHKPSTGIVDQDKDGSTDDDWRRKNVDTMMKDLYNRIQATKPWVRFGMGTFGIWTMKSTVASAYGISLPSGITGLDDYEEQACNPVEWVKGGYVDYINPQLYWPTTSSGQSYSKLVKWWGQDVCEHFSNLLPGKQKVHFFSSQSCSSNTASSEIIKQIDYNRQYLSSGYTGSVFYNTTAYLKMYSALTSRFAYLALPPAMDWKVTEILGAPENMILSGTTLMWSHPSATRFTIYVYPKSISLESAKANPIYLKQIVYGNSYSVSGIDLTNYSVAVFSYDRFGVEHAAAVYGGSSDSGTGDGGEDPDPGTSTEIITWELNGGEVKSVAVPTQEELWVSFKTDAAITTLGTLSEIASTTSTTPCQKICGTLTADKLESVFANSHWKWLKDYIQNVQTSQAGTTIVGSDGITRAVAELPDDISSAGVQWRYATAAFFLQTQYTAYPATANFATEGQSIVWGPAYQTANGGSSLPSSVTTTFVLPTPTHPEGYTFLGWYDNPEFTGTVLTSIPAGWTGTLYAKWQTSTTDDPIVDPTKEVIFWELNGGYVPATVPTNLELWEMFKPYYNTYYGLNRSDMTIDKVATFASDFMEDIMTNAASEYKWLGDYILIVADTIKGESAWRWHVHAFFNCNDGTLSGNQLVATVDFSVAGQPSEWGAAYQKVHTAELPKYVASTYILPNALKEGYTFEGWYNNSEFSGSALSSIPAGWEGTLYAKWAEESAENPQVIFWNLNGGTVEVELPKYVTTTYTLPIPTRKGYVFGGWYDNVNFIGTAITSIPANWQGSLYAKWTEETPEEVIYWVLNGGSVSGTLPSFVTNTYELPTPVRDGYIFSGWYDNPEFAESALSSIPAGWEGTLYAKWIEEENNNDIKWELNGGSYKNGTLPTSVSRRYTLPKEWELTPPYSGCSFEGWYDNPEFSGNSMTRISGGWKGTLHAKWDCSSSNAEVIFWELNGGTVEMSSVTIPSQETLWENFKTDYNEYFETNLDATLSSASNFLYSGSYYLEKEVGTLMTDADAGWTWLGEYIISFAGSPADNDLWWRTQLHAFFNCLSDYTLGGYVATDYSIAGQPTAWGEAYQAAQPAELPKFVLETYVLPTPIREGYTFRGWFDNANFGGYVLTSIPAGWEGTLYAKWTENAPAVEIYWVLNGGYTKTTLPTHVTDTYILPPLFREGYTFAGWYDNAEFSGFYLEEIPAGWQGTLYAKWAESTGGPEPEEPTTITWELNGGKENPYDWSCKEDMWIMFQDDYRAFYGVEIRNYSMDSCAKWTYDACGDGKAITEMLMYEEKWIWLYDYMGKVAYNANFNNGQLGTPVLLRFSLHAFLNNSAGNNNTYSGNPDYTLNGQLSYWYLDWGYTWKGYLPTSLTSTYLLPKAYKEGRTFLGWSTDPKGVGYITELPAGFVGTVYAIWDVMDDVPTSIKTNIMIKDQCMYDILGRRVDNTYKGIVIIDGKKYLLK